MLISERIAETIVSSANISETDTVLEIGTGNGILTRLLSKISGEVITYEIDDHLFNESVVSLSSLENVKVIHCDPLDVSNLPTFDACVTSLPYSQSVRFVKWLALRSGSFRNATAVVQKEFATKLCSESARESYRAVSVLGQLSFKIRRLFEIDKSEFRPEPKVRSEAISISPRLDIRQPFFTESRVGMLNYLFSFRRKLVSRALRDMKPKEFEFSLEREILSKRVETLTPYEFGTIIREMENW